MGQQPLPPRKPYSKVLISQTTSENSFRSKVHPAARSSTDGHRVSARTIRSGGVPAQVHNGKIRSCRQGRDFHSALPRLLWKILLSTSLLRSHYKTELRRALNEGLLGDRQTARPHGVLKRADRGVIRTRIPCRGPRLLARPRRHGARSTRPPVG